MMLLWRMFENQMPPRPAIKEWAPPTVGRRGCRDLSAEELRDLAGGNEELPEWLRDYQDS